MATIRESLIKMLGGQTATDTKQVPGVPQNAQFSFHSVGASVSRRSGYKDFAEEGYQENAVVYRCINEIAQGAASIPYKVKHKGNTIERHPLCNLLDRPNPLQAHNEYFQALYSYLLISGNSYALKIRSEQQRGVRELHLFRPDRMRVKPSGNFIPAGYEYVINSQVIAEYDADPENGQSEVKHFKMWNPMDDYYGMSPIYAASADIDQHNMIAKHNVNLLQNGARPTGAFIFNPKDQKSGFNMQLTSEQRRQLQQDIDDRVSGTGNSGRAMLLEGDFDWKEMGLSPRDMDFLQSRNMAARDIALCFGVPGQLVGVPDSQTYANVAEARLALYEETIIPLARRIESDINEWLTPEYQEEGLYFCYDIDEIPAIAERRRKVYENVVSGVREGIISRNEARDRLGLGEVEGGDDVYIAANLFPLGSAKDSAVDTSDENPASDDMYEEIANDDADEMPGEEDGEKAESDVNLVPTAAMAEEAAKGLGWRAEFKRGGTAVGVARATQLKNRDRLSPRTVARMVSYFARHEVDKQAEGFREGEKGYPSAGRIAWALWGGDAGKAWANRKSKELNAEKSIQDLVGDMAEGEYLELKKVALSERMKEALKNKVKDHNDKHGDDPKKKVTLRMLEAVFRRGVGAYHTNPESVRPNVTGPDQWGLGRVNAFLRAVRTGKFPRGRFDTDLMPEGHPLSSKE